MTSISQDSTTRKIAWLVTDHGFGHAARASAIIASLLEKSPAAHVELFTSAPAWFFDESLPAGRHTLHSLHTDVGVVQQSPLLEDLPATLARLADFYPLAPPQVNSLAAHLTALGCRQVVCDIAPLGIAAAAAAGLPSILVENFTWDWIYQGYLAAAPEFARPIDLLHDLFARASLHVQTEPLCAPDSTADLRANPACRKPHTPRADLRRQLSMPSTDPMVLISMGGVPPDNFEFIQHLQAYHQVWFVIPGGSAHLIQRRGNVILLPHHSNFYHPDLLFAANAVVGKVGYSTIAEAYHAGIPFAYVTRPRFRESPPLAAFIQANMQGFEIGEDEFQAGAWIDHLSALLNLPRITRAQPNGADQIADFILSQ